MKEAWIEKTEQYLSNVMSTEERSLFESEMAANDELSSYVILYREIETTMHTREKNNAAKEALKDSLKKLNASYFDTQSNNNSGIAHGLKEAFSFDQETATLPRSNKKQRTIKTWIFLAVAAAISGIIAIAITWYSQKKETLPPIAGSEKKDTIKNAAKPGTAFIQKNIPSNLAIQKADSSAAENKQAHALTKKRQEELFADNFKPDAVPDITEGALEDAFDYYANKNYADAAQEFGSADLNAGTRGLETDPGLTAFYAEYYGGISYLAKGAAEKAITQLTSAITKSPGELFQVKAEWYLALAYLKKDDVKNASEILTKISMNKKETEYKLKANQLLAELK